MSGSVTSSGGLRRYRIVVLGDGGVGKSALTLQYVQHNFIDYHDPTIEDAYQQRTVIDSEPCLLDILDTAGQVEFTAMREQYMRCGEGFIICYSITERHSFNEAVEYRNLISKVRVSEDVPIILVANKVDLEQTQRMVETREGEALAEKFGCPFYETSAAHRRHVDDVFHSLVREISTGRQKSKLDTLTLNAEEKEMKRCCVRSLIHQDGKNFGIICFKKLKEVDEKRFR